MKAKQKFAILALAVIALAASYWTGYVHGSANLPRSEVIISVALPVILIWTLAKLTFAFIFRGNRMNPPGGGSPPSAGPSSGVPVPRPPGPAPQVYYEHAV